MPAPSRRTLLTLMGALALAPSAALGADGKQVDAKKVFPYLDAYLKLPVADRSRFRLAYYFRSNGKPLAVRPDGRVESDPRPWRSWRVARCRSTSSPEPRWG